MKKTGRLNCFLLLMSFMTMLVSCEALFTTNLFGNLDKVDLSNMSDHEKAVTVLFGADAAIEGMSETGINKLISDLDALAADTGEDKNVRLQAAAASSAVHMSSSGADSTINNLGNLATSINDGSLTIESPDDILSAIFSDDDGNPLTAAQIEVQLDAMIAAATALETYGDILGTDGSSPAGVDPDAIAITAVVTGLLEMAGGNTGEIAAVIADPEGAADDNGDGIPNVFEGLPDMSDLADDPVGALFSSRPGLGNVITGAETVTSILDYMNQ